VPGTAHVLRVNLQFPIMKVKASPKPSEMEVKGIVLSQRGVSVPKQCSYTRRLRAERRVFARKIFHVPRDAAYGRKWLRGRDVQVMIFIK
jgi:hypothetical protein